MMKRQGVALGLVFLVAGFVTLSGGGCEPDSALPGSPPDEASPSPGVGSEQPPGSGSSPAPGSPSDPGTSSGTTPAPDTGSPPPETTPTPDAGTSRPPVPPPVPVPGTEPEPPPPPPPALPGYGANLLLNPNAEAAPGSTDDSSSPVPHWTLAPGSAFTAVQYGAAGFPTAGDQGPPDRGLNFFAGGQAPESVASQDVDVARLAPEIDEGTVKVVLSGFLGGFSKQKDNASVTARFRTADGLALGTLSIGPVSSQDRLETTGLFLRRAAATVPKGTRSIQVVIRLLGPDGTYNDAYVDNLLLVLTR